LEASKPGKPPFSETQSFPGKYESLARIGDFVRRVAKDASFEKFSVYSIEMAVDEACSNIIEHAYGGEDKGEIRCTCSVSEQALTITLADKGQSFDPFSVPPPNLSSNLDDREAHGLGLYFIRQWMDEVAFHSTGSENILTMVKRR
jgi:anti-sigma regulatory factor (Ser/Thr protein kinase)